MTYSQLWSKNKIWRRDRDLKTRTLQHSQSPSELPVYLNGSFSWRYRSLTCTWNRCRLVFVPSSPHMTRSLSTLASYVNSFPQDGKLQMGLFPFQSKTRRRKPSVLKRRAEGEMNIFKTELITEGTRVLFLELPSGFWKTTDVVSFISSYSLLLWTRCRQSYCRQAPLVSSPNVFIHFLLFVIYISALSGSVKLYHCSSGLMQELLRIQELNLSYL